MGICYGKYRGQKKAIAPGYEGSKGKEPPQKVHVYGADAFELVSLSRIVTQHVALIFGNHVKKTLL